MAKKRPSAQKRQREYLKRQREFEKAEKAALKRQRRLNGEDAEDTAPADEAENRETQREDTAPSGD